MDNENTVTMTLTDEEWAKVVAALLNNGFLAVAKKVYNNMMLAFAEAEGAE